MAERKRNTDAPSEGQETVTDGLEPETPRALGNVGQICDVCGALLDENHAHRLADGTIES